MSDDFSVTAVEKAKGWGRDKTYEYKLKSVDEIAQLKAAHPTWSFSEAGAVYNANTNVATLYRRSGSTSNNSVFGQLSPSETIRWNLLHEIGHFYHFQSMSIYPDRASRFIEMKSSYREQQADNWANANFK